MTDGDDDPPWDLLPENPQGFFGLGTTHDLKELKRRYNRLIKQFKPERHPEEFQKIRAAYEALEWRLRYQAPQEPNDQSNPVVPAPDAPTEAVHALSTPTPTDREIEDLPIQYYQPAQRSQPTLTLLEKVQTTPPETLRAELRLKSPLNQEEQLLLAFLEDADAADSELAFLNQLLQIYRAHPDEQTWQQLFDYLETDEAQTNCEPFLRHIFAELASEAAFGLTEPLWKALQAQAPFKQYRQVLDECIRHVPDYRHYGRLMFDLRIIKQTLFYADDDWIDEQLQGLLRGDVDWPEWLDVQIWNLERLVNYARDRRFLNGDPLRARIDQVIQAYCADAPDFEQRFWNLQTEFLNDFEAVSRAFPFRCVHVEAAWEIWQWISDQTIARSDRDSSPSLDESLNALRFLPAKLGRASRPLLSRRKNWKPWVKILLRCLYIGLPACFSYASLCAIGSQSDVSVWIVNSIVLWIPLGFLAAFFVHLSLAAIDVSTNSWLGWANYDMGMRREITNFIRCFPLPTTMLNNHLRGFTLSENRANHVLAHFEHDYALRFYSTAAWCLR